MLIHGRDYRLPGARQPAHVLRSCCTSILESSNSVMRNSTVAHHGDDGGAVRKSAETEIRGKTIEKNVESRTRVRDAADITLRLWTMTLGAEVC